MRVHAYHICITCVSYVSHSYRVRASRCVSASRVCSVSARISAYQTERIIISIRCISGSISELWGGAYQRVSDAYRSACIAWRVSEHIRYISLWIMIGLCISDRTCAYQHISHSIRTWWSISAYRVCIETYRRAVRIGVGGCLRALYRGCVSSGITVYQFVS